MFFFLKKKRDSSSSKRSRFNLRCIRSLYFFTFTLKQQIITHFFLSSSLRRMSHLKLNSRRQELQPTLLNPKP